MISSIIFDYGGTLDGEGYHWLNRFYDIYESMGLIDIPKPLIKEAFYWADHQVEMDTSINTAKMRDMMEKHVAWQFQKLNLNDRDLQSRMVEAFCGPAEEALRRSRQVLETLHRQGFRMGVVSNFYGNVQTLCDEAGLCDYLETIIDSIIVSLQKPDPQIFKLALERLGVAAENTAFVGDSYERLRYERKSRDERRRHHCGRLGRAPRSENSESLDARWWTHSYRFRVGWT
jgi:HAD superfamily hydrolase (TIGR01509 family)